SAGDETNPMPAGIRANREGWAVERGFSGPCENDAIVHHQNEANAPARDEPDGFRRARSPGTGGDLGKRTPQKRLNQAQIRRTANLHPRHDEGRSAVVERSVWPTEWTGAEGRRRPIRVGRRPSAGDSPGRVRSEGPEEREEL